MTEITERGRARLERVMAAHVASGSAAGLVWAVGNGRDVHVGTAGTADEGGGGAPVARDTIFRLSSMTKPITALAVMMLVEECVLRLDDPVDDVLPELADRVVLRDPSGPLDDTVPAVRPITVRDVLTFRLGLGMDMAHWDRPQPVLERAAELGLGAGPPQPQGPPEPDEWIRRLGTLPLSYQPGERWLYHVGADVAGVLVARASGQPAVFDPADGQWAAPPAFPGGGAGLVSTVDDYLAFAELMLGRGAARGARLVSSATIDAMVRVHVADGVDPDGAVGWGLGLAVQLRQTGIARSPGSYGWDGGLGSSWANDPARGLIGILLTNRSWSSPSLPRSAQDFWTCAATACEP